MNNKLPDDYKKDLYNNIMNRRSNRKRILKNVFCLLFMFWLIMGFNIWGILECK